MQRSALGNCATPADQRLLFETETNNNPGPRCQNSIQRFVSTRRFKRFEPRIDADVAVFGHTHVPSIETYTPPKGREAKTLVNAGSWVKRDGNIGDTFVFIDESAPRLPHWNGDGSVSQMDKKLL